MGIHIESQHEAEYNQIKAREKQQESINKLNDIIPVVSETQDILNNVDLEQVSADNNIIKDVVVRNLEEQTDIDEIKDAVDSLTKKINTLTKKMNTLLKTVNDIHEKINDGDK